MSLYGASKTQQLNEYNQDMSEGFKSRGIIFTLETPTEDLQD